MKLANRLCLCGLGLASGLCHAQSAPLPVDAGALQHQIEQGLAPHTRAADPKAAPSVAAPTAPLNTEATVVVRQFRFDGNHALRDDQLNDALLRFLNTPLGFNQLNEASNAVAAAYRAAGWIANVTLAPQEIADGVVQMHVVEAVFGDVRIDAPQDLRVPPQWLQEVARASLPHGEALRADKVDQALLLTHDVPGVVVSGTLAQGQAEGSTDLILLADNSPLLSGTLSADNQGGLSTGAERGSAQLVFNSLGGFADMLVVDHMESLGTSYLRWDYSVPAGYLGTRAGVQSSSLNYKLVGQFSALQASGNSGGWGVYGNTPLLRSANDNVSLNLSYDEKHFKNSALSNSAPALVSDYTLSVWRATLNRTWYDEHWGYALNSWTFTASTGQVNLGTSPNQADDAQFAQTAGEFTKFNLGWSRQQFLSESLTLAATLAGQTASRNLDSSEKLFLGGPTGVRAYPVNEVGGSVGQTLSLELRQRLNENWTLSGFGDYGQVYVYANNQKSGGGLLTTQNLIELSGHGLSLAWQGHNGVRAAATWAHRSGTNPVANATTGADADGSHEMERYWFTVAVSF